MTGLKKRVNFSPVEKKENSIPKHIIINADLWEKLRKGNPEYISSAAEVTYDWEKGCYRIPVLNQTYIVYPYEEIIKKEEGGWEERFKVELSLFLLHYLLGAKPIPLSGKKVSEKGLKGGFLFFRGIHGLAKERIIEKYGCNKEGFLMAGLRLGGIKREGGDASFEILPAPKIPVTYILWMEDEEFGASLNVLFDTTIELFLPLDVIYGLSLFLEYKIVEN